MAHQGFATWNPTAASIEILGQVEAVLEEYKDHLPLTGRQIFYRLVGAFGYEKTEQAANRLYGVLGRARRAGMLPFNVIRDGGGSRALPLTWDDADAFWRDVRDRSEHFTRDRQSGQPVYVELFCEAPSMLPQLQRVAFQYSVPVYGTRGFTGLSVVRDIAHRALTRDRATVLLQIGDYDPSGESIFASMAGDAGEFVDQVTWAIRERQHGGELAEALGLGVEDIERLERIDFKRLPELHPKRIALTPEQVEEHNLPTAPPSSKDSRSKSWVGETAQAEAMPPDLLARIVRESIEGEFDMNRYAEEIEDERADEAEIERVLQIAEGEA